MTRLNKYIAECGICSRREADRLIENGSVAVNGKVATVGMAVSDEDEIIINGNKLAGKNSKVVLAFNKPVGVVCSEKDTHGEVTIKDVLDYPMRVTYAGRLDKDSEGLLLLTNDGELINELMRGKNNHDKEYIVRVTKELTPDFKEKMEGGIFLKELNIKTKPCRVNVIDPYTFSIILTQGVNRQIRRMCDTLGYRVKELTRIRVANIELGRLHPGTYRRITGEELKALYRQVNL